MAQGQEQVEFTADRPGASTDPSVVGHHVMQLEQGIQYDGDGGAGTITFSNTLLRYGLFPRMELRLGGDGFLYRPEDAVKGYKAAFSGLSLGTKISCFESLVVYNSSVSDFLFFYKCRKSFSNGQLHSNRLLSPACLLHIHAYIVVI